MAQMVKNRPTVWETWVQSLNWEDSLEDGMATHSNILAWYAPTSNAEKNEVEWFYEDRQDVLLIIGDWNAKVGRQEIPGVTGKFGLGVQNEAGQSLTEFCQENTLVIANTLFQNTREDSTYQIRSDQLLSRV